MSNNQELRQILEYNGLYINFFFSFSREETKVDDVNIESEESKKNQEAENHKILNSKLNANAAEFIPLSNQNQNSINHTNQVRLLIIYSNILCY